MTRVAPPPGAPKSAGWGIKDEIKGEKKGINFGQSDRVSGSLLVAYMGLMRWVGPQISCPSMRVKVIRSTALGPGKYLPWVYQHSS